MDSTQLRDLILEEADKVDPVDIRQVAEAVIQRLSRADKLAVLPIVFPIFIRNSINQHPHEHQVPGVGAVNGFTLGEPAAEPAECRVGRSRRMATAADWKLKLNALVAPHRSGEYKRLGQCTVDEVLTLKASHESLESAHRLKAEWYGTLADAMSTAKVKAVADLPELHLRPLLEVAPR